MSSPGSLLPNRHGLANSYTFPMLSIRMPYFQLKRQSRVKRVKDCDIEVRSKKHVLECNRVPALGYVARSATGVLEPFAFTRRAPKEDDVVIKVEFCCMCHSDLHSIRNEWGNATYPMVPGHGTVMAVGSAVTDFHVGDTVGVGCLVGACLDCESCEKGLENYCDQKVFTYNSLLPDGSFTQGGYSTAIVVNDQFVLHIPENLPKDAAEPLLCAAITVWSPMFDFGMDKQGARFGVVGLGGLGHMAVKFGKAFGMHVTVFSTSPNKEQEARELLGADDFVVSTDVHAMDAKKKSIDFIIDTVSVPHSLDAYLDTLKVDGKMCLVGLPTEKIEVSPWKLVMNRITVTGSVIGGMKETELMLQFCSIDNISCLVETLPIEECNTAVERLQKNDVKYRFVLDLKNLHDQVCELLEVMCAAISHAIISLQVRFMLKQINK